MAIHRIGFVGFLFVSLSLLLTSDAGTPSKLEDEYWGPTEHISNTGESVRPFKIVFDKKMIDDLKMRLNNTRQLQPPLQNVGWSYGVSSDFTSTLVDYWLNKYDFKERQSYLNQYPQFITNIQGLDIHFLRVKPQLPSDRKIEVLPLYIQHGWPTSVVEFYRLIPMLTTVHPKRDFVFEVIAPSLPGFGYSSAPAKAGLGPVEIAQVMKNLMLRLGFTKWYAQGGDLSGLIVANMAAMYPEHVLGIHSHYCLVLHPAHYLKLAFNAVGFLSTSDLHQMQIPQIFGKLLQLMQENGYIHLQATKPDTIGVAMSDSPAGLAAYILEKFATGTRNDVLGYRDDRNMLRKLSMDELLDNVMLYWVPNKATTSFRLYAEILSGKNCKNEINYAKIEVPSACTQLPLDSFHLPEVLLRERFSNLVSLTKMPRGGNFVAMEEPRLLANDIWSAVKKMRE